ncbi:hypothetical protein HTSR_0867 [Halodesulfurarchaeum formicicum]|uniref:DUF5615 domain-containing protein n=1 Tax=Halodesulfurarchaeum formicicum TaxID=1873524 RepID=A0A1D8S3W9_9EURY|nr:DUF5615 family PIN-like protein [Halodesulfurarchaeum formicicum]AOW80052.1 hypothetical protein HTSR_0867 [Halodesulfurarchaeum formicicum]APE95337.1 hypothetical protein HSR6_0884 [Halodesulfurarchaeum formicicum]
MDFLLDEHITRVFERVLRERGHAVVQAKDEFGEQTTDSELLRWCGETETVLVTNNAKDFIELHEPIEHAGLLVVFDQRLPDSDPEGLARTVDVVLQQYGAGGLADEIVDLDHWYSWLQS